MAEDKNLRKVENEDELFERISKLVDESRNHISKVVNTAMVYTYYSIGQYVIEYEQSGKYRAAYGKGVLNRLSRRLTDEYGKGWSVETLTKCRKFYYVYSISSDCQTKLPVSQKSSAQQTKSAQKENLSVEQKISAPEFALTWNHYQILMRIDNPEERSFYEIESRRHNWGYKWLQRQVASSLYERLALSRDKAEVMRLAEKGQVIEKPSDVIKNPIALEFLGLKPDSSYSESKLENAIISKLQTFLLEMGKGFLFEARQKSLLQAKVREWVEEYEVIEMGR